MSEYKPGTVAVATVRFVPDKRVMATSDRGWVSVDCVKGPRFHRASEVTDIRPLVVLDQSQTDTVVNCLRIAHGHEGGNHRLTLASLIEAQAKPPKPPEPTGLGAVVEEVHGQRWVWAGDETEGGEHLYVKVNSSDGLHAYASLDVTKVLSEGVPS